MEFLWFSLIRAPHLERGLKPLGEFPAAGGPQTFFAGPPTVCVCRSRGRSPAVSTSCVLLRVAGAGATHSPPAARTSSSRRRKSRHSPQAAGTGRRPGRRIPPAGSRTQYVLPRTSTASWVHSFRKGPPKLPSVFGETSFDPTFRMALLLVSLPTADGYGVTACFIAAVLSLIER